METIMQGNNNAWKQRCIEKGLNNVWKHGPYDAWKRGLNHAWKHGSVI